MTARRRLTIFEGPDGSGKTTAAKTLAAATGAHYVHLGPFEGVFGLPRFYAEAMSPAVLGLRDVVMDRSWLSEPIYGAVFRGGLNRVGQVEKRMLERLATGCDVGVVLCLPPLERVLAAFNGRRKDGELPKGDSDVVEVYAAYDRAYADPAWTSLPVATVDPFDVVTRVEDVVSGFPCENAGIPLGVFGGADAKVAVVTSVMPEHTDFDPLVQCPAAGFGDSYSVDLYRWLQHFEVSERDVAWLCAAGDRTSEDLESVERWLSGFGRDRLLADGRVARDFLINVGVQFTASAPNCTAPILAAGIARRVWEAKL